MAPEFTERIIVFLICSKMKKLFYLLMMSFLVAYSSCKKEDRIIDQLGLNSEATACGVKDPLNNLGWLKKIVQDAKKGGADRYLTISMVDYNGGTYFESWLGYSSCMGCAIYDCGGRTIDFQSITSQQRSELIQALRGDESTVLWGRRE